MPIPKPINPTRSKKEDPPEQRKTTHSKKWDTANKERALAMHAMGISNREIARQIGTSEARIRRLLVSLNPKEEADLERLRLQLQVRFVESAYQEIWAGLADLKEKRKEASYKDVVWGVAVLADKIAAIPLPPPGVNHPRLKDYIRTLVQHKQIDPAVVMPEYRKTWRADMEPEENAIVDWLISVGLLQTEDPPERAAPPSPKVKTWWEIQEEEKAARHAKEWQEFQEWKATQANLPPGKASKATSVNASAPEAQIR